MQKFLIGTGALLMLAGAGIWLLVPVTYEAFALLKISGTPPSVLEARAVTGDEFAVFKRTQAQLMLSGLVLQRAVSAPGINKLPTIQAHNDSPANWLKSQLTVDFPDDSEILRVTMTGTNADDITKIVDAVVKKYQSEVVQRASDLRLEQERKLTDAHASYNRKYQEAATTLHQLELVNKTSGTGAAQVSKRLAEDQLREAIAYRNRLKQQVRDNAMQIVLLKAREAESTNIRTAGGEAVDSDKLTLPQLSAQREYLEELRDISEEDIAAAAKYVENIENFSAQVTAKQEELAAIRNVVTELRGTLDRISVEKLAEERITVLDHATLANPEGDYWPRTGYAEVLGLVGLGVLVLGLSRKRLS